MDKIVALDHVAQYNSFFGQETLHPLISVVDFSKAKTIDFSNLNPGETHRIRYGFYSVFLKDVKCGDIIYGRNHYDYQEGTLVFMSPGQVFSITRNSGVTSPRGFALLIHPDFLRGTALGHTIRNYSFFSYEVFEALHLSEQERQIIVDCFHKIQIELNRPIDKHSKTLITSNIELLLNYCVRFYDRQFITRENVNKDILAEFEKLLDNYFQSDRPVSIGLPSVSYCASQLHISTNYFGDLIKKETGKSAQEYIHLKLIDLAKDKIFSTNKTIKEIAFELGFKYPQHFARMFKNETGYSPNQMRSMN